MSIRKVIAYFYIIFPIWQMTHVSNLMITYQRGRPKMVEMPMFVGWLSIHHFGFESPERRWMDCQEMFYRLSQYSEEES